MGSLATRPQSLLYGPCKFGYILALVSPSPLAPYLSNTPTTRFYVNLLCSEEEGSEAALHFNPRLDESVVVFNTKKGGTWGKEERGRGIPFQRGQPFDVLLITTEKGFKVSLCHRGGCRVLGHSWPRLGRLSPVPLTPVVQPH